MSGVMLHFQRNVLNIILVTVGLSLVIAGCRPSVNRENSSITTPQVVNETQSPSTLVPEPTNTVALVAQLSSPAPDISATIAPTATPTETLVPTGTATATPSPTNTKTPPLPTLSPEEAVHQVMALLEDNQNPECVLPCWWGATPGQTSWEQVNGLITSLSAKVFEPSDLMNGTYEIFFPHIPEGVTSDTLGLGVSYHVNEGVIEKINVTGGNMPAYYLQPILANYGTPDEVWLQAMPYTPSGEVIFRIALLYLEKGFSAHILTRDRYLEDQRVVGCYSDESRQGTSLFFWIPGQYNSFPAIVEAGRFGQEASSYLPLKEATDMDIESFFDMYRVAEGDNCISTPIDTWE